MSYLSCNFCLENSVAIIDFSKHCEYIKKASQNTFAVSPFFNDWCDEDMLSLFHLHVCVKDTDERLVKLIQMQNNIERRLSIHKLDIPSCITCSILQKDCSSNLEEIHRNVVFEINSMFDF